ncbi:DUF3038 domain-containing protein [filamentous cyanobacterium LEGE 11480]|uniref:DUF3038 domain-containing protein n=1 Tax=Romeriopsis navalis LEGE 11480 TaxID=2777977 RepID=A0A928VL41_9CYAN|nr:DUF3038 domain-containing protein [Romeriopsis navalis]MBE9030561.1 DUF3038 domain-containing protein [Romeriopsis navalis LEGE 11480]
MTSSSSTSTSSVPSLAAFPLVGQPDPTQLDNIKTQLDLVLLALESLANIGSEAMLQAAEVLNLETVIADRVSLWRLRQANPLRKGQGGRKKLDVEEARAMVLICCHLAKQQQELIRRAVALLEQLTEQNKPPHHAALLGDYLDQFQNTYQERMEEANHPDSEGLTHLGLKLLIDLLFYGGPQGAKRLWLALLERSMASSPH